MKAGHFAAIATLGLVLAGCAHEPTVDISAAKHALDEARAAQADQYAPESWNAATDAEAKLEIELDAQAKRWAAVRTYNAARELALDAKAAAERSQQDAIAGKQRMTTEASTLMKQARDAYARAQAAVASAPKGKGTEADLVSLKSDATSIDQTLSDMQRAFDAGDYIGAKTKAQAAIDASQSIEKEIQRATAARRAA